MAKNENKTFCIEYETGLSKKDRDLCEKKLRIGRSIYNACLGEALKRLNNCHNDPRYKQLAKNYKESESILISLKSELEALNKNGDQSRKRIDEIKGSIKDVNTVIAQYSSELNAITNEHRCSGKYSLSDFRKKQSAHFKGGIGAQIACKLSERAFLTAKKISENKNGRIRYVQECDDFTIEGACNLDSVYLKNGMLHFDRKTALTIKPSRRHDEEYYDEAMQNRIKYCQLFSKTIRGKKRYFVRVLLEGTPPNRREYGNGKLDLLDVKISHIELTKGDNMEKIELAPGCKDLEEKIAEINRKMHASRFANNPENFDKNGRLRSGIKRWNYSLNYKKLTLRKKELYRKMRERRRISHEILTNKILKDFTDIRIKKLPYEVFKKGKYKYVEKESVDVEKRMQKVKQGKNIGNRAPSEFVEILKRKLSYIDKELIEITSERN